MACYHPVKCFQLADGSLFFGGVKAATARHDVRRDLYVACGHCVGCRLERARQWAIRCVHEASQHKRNAFITLTYDDAHVPPDYSLRYRDFQLFMKRLRKKFGAVRFYMCGEYGEDFARPHFHACLFGVDFDDKLHWSKSGGSVLYRSAILDRLWGNGFASVGEVTFESAAYCARYIMKKVNGDLAQKHYESIIASTGEIVQRCPEFNHMSLKPGIGRQWIDDFVGDVYPDGMVVSKGVEVRPPSYYDKWFKERFPLQWEEMAWSRELYARDRAEDSTPERLSVREAVTSARLGLLKRSI